MEEVMRKMSQITTASLKISILALLFIVTAAPHIRDYGGTKLHQKNLEREKGVATGVCPDDRNHFAAKTNCQAQGQTGIPSNELGKAPSHGFVEEAGHHATPDKFNVPESPAKAAITEPQTTQWALEYPGNSLFNDGAEASGGRSMIKPEKEQVLESSPALKDLVH